MLDPTQYVTPLLFGHRGTILFRPENTMAAFDYAFDEGGDGIEIDVRRAATGELIAIHDSSLQRVTDNADNRNVRDLSLEELQAIDVGSWFDAEYADQRIPTLEEVLDASPADAFFMFDVKSDDAAEGIASFIEENQLEKRAWVASAEITRLDTVNDANAFISLVYWLPKMSDLGKVENPGVDVIRIPKSVEDDPKHVDTVLERDFSVAISGSFISWQTRFGLVNNMAKTVDRRADRKPDGLE